MIKRACPIANWIKLEAQDYNEIQKRVSTDSQEKQKTDPSFSGICPSTITWFYNTKLPQLMEQQSIQNMVNEKIKELDQKATNIKRQQLAQNNIWEKDINIAEMEAERLKEVVLNGKKNLQPQ